VSRLAERSATELVVTVELGLAELHGPGLAGVGSTAVTSSTYEVSQPWSHAIHSHPANVDGIVYRSNHDNGELCVALFDRCRDRLRPGSRTGLMADRAALAELLDRYRIGLS